MEKVKVFSQDGVYTIEPRPGLSKCGAQLETIFDSLDSQLACIKTVGAIGPIALSPALVETRESEPSGADLSSDSGEFGLSGKFGKILSINQMQKSIDSGCSAKACGKSTRRFARREREREHLRSD
ncbi:hypothetical protein AVEN_160940-1 [Araneus ventricosus]|uniref:Uncharacterized protein n=1 Tax=Araneus ventricosus TaxID=182803 RepID=A0A4Y2JS50_ARAVE|nr:hypothetical protein AVEN_160940-1 [Araneus ventricosus]